MDPRSMKAEGSMYVGKVRSNFFGTEFAIYDGGENPTKKGVLAE